jgi:putative exporter of polyketide antibiotics
LLHEKELEERASTTNGYFVLGSLAYMSVILLAAFTTKAVYYEEPEELKVLLVRLGTSVVWITIISLVLCVTSMAVFGGLSARTPIGWLPGLLLAFIVLVLNLPKSLGGNVD